ASSAGGSGWSWQRHLQWRRRTSSTRRGDISKVPRHHIPSPTLASPQKRSSPPVPPVKLSLEVRTSWSPTPSFPSP
uniref:Uncharacterized protein n=1 Tax=Triticum urartu TaxID=4572 RepID=A0A8R7PAI5_TRIUA